MATAWVKLKGPARNCPGGQHYARGTGVVNDLTALEPWGIIGVWSWSDCVCGNRVTCMAVQAVLFDFDGVIADTVNVHVVAWQRTLSTLGWRVSDEVAARAGEVDDRAFLSDLFAKRGIESDKVDEWVRRKQVLTVELLKDSPRLHRGGGGACWIAAGQGEVGGGFGDVAREY